MAKLVDSGQRTNFGGALKEDPEGKGRCDLLPLDIIVKILANEYCLVSTALYPLQCIDEYQRTGEWSNLAKAIKAFAVEDYNGSYTEMFIALGKHYGDGARKYGERNWQNGYIPTKYYISSAVRHYLKYLEGWNDEPHDRAFVWNLVAALWNHEHYPNGEPSENEEEENK